MTAKFVIALAVLSGLGAIANGLFMLVDPANWYFAIPGVTTTGPFNQHFIRDIGFTYVFVGSAYLTGAAKPTARTLLWGSAALWLIGHALFHAWEVAAGICGPSALLRDFPAVTLPAILGALFTGWSARRDHAAHIQRS